MQHLICLARIGLSNTKTPPATISDDRRYPDYIEQLVVSGSKVEPAVINFSKGLNIITGASNTGKSLIVDCIDHAFGYKKQPRNNHDRTPTLIGYGYESVRMTLRTERGTVCVERVFGENKVIITGDDS